MGKYDDDEPKKTGRKKIQIDKKSFEDLCMAQCTEEEVCAHYGITRPTIVRWCYDTYGVSFKDAATRFRDTGKAALRTKQWKQAMKYPSMAVWLGKQYLGQTDKPVADIGKVVFIKDDVALETEDGDD